MCCHSPSSSRLRKLMIKSSGSAGLFIISSVSNRCDTKHTQTVAASSTKPQQSGTKLLLYQWKCLNII